MVITFSLNDLDKFSELVIEFNKNNNSDMIHMKLMGLKLQNLSIRS